MQSAYTKGKVAVRMRQDNGPSIFDRYSILNTQEPRINNIGGSRSLANKVLYGLVRMYGNGEAALDSLMLRDLEVSLTVTTVKATVSQKR